MSDLALENTGLGLLPFTYLGDKASSLDSIERNSVRRGKILGATAMALNACWDTASISNQLVNLFSSANGSLDYSNFSSDVTSLTIATAWASANMYWLNRNP